MMKMQLAHDICRCAGNSCDRRHECARAQCIPETGYVPWSDRFCEPGCEAEGFILLRAVPVEPAAEVGPEGRYARLESE